MESNTRRATEIYKRKGLNVIFAHLGYKNINDLWLENEVGEKLVEGYKNDITSFVKNFNVILFKCTNIEYHQKTGKISKLTFEQIEK